MIKRTSYCQDASNNKDWEQVMVYIFDGVQEFVVHIKLEFQ